MNYLQLREFAFLAQASYRGLSMLSRGARPSELEARLTSSDALGIDNRF
jgi:hypothetical protein